MACVRRLGLESRYPTVASNNRFNSGHKSCRGAEYRCRLACMRTGRTRRRCCKRCLDRTWRGAMTFAVENVPFNRPFAEGVIARMTEDDEKARSAFTAARAEQEKIVQAQPNYGPALCVLGLIDAGL